MKHTLKSLAPVLILSIMFVASASLCGRSLHAQAAKPLQWPYNRLADICKIAKEYRIGHGHTLAAYCPQIQAHFLKECGTLDAYCHWKPGDKTSDGGWAIGMVQWHLCYQYPDWLRQNKLAIVTPHGCTALVPIAKIRDRFYADHPEMRDWRYQVNKYMADIIAKMTAYQSRHAGASDIDAFHAAIRSWNASPSYLPSILFKAARLPSTDI